MVDTWGLRLVSPILMENTRSLSINKSKLSIIQDIPGFFIEISNFVKKGLIGMIPCKYTLRNWE